MNELIVYKDWEKLVVEELGGTCWETGQPLPHSPYVFSTAEHVDNLFRNILEDQTYEDKFVLISAASDAGPTYQAECNGKHDIRNWVNMDPNLEEIGYHDYICRSRHEKRRCLDRDRFCFKMYSWMSSTFPVIPKQVKAWFTTNCQIEEGRVFPIPFGISPEAKLPIESILGYTNPKDSIRTNKVVACWSNTTNQRSYIKASLDRSCFLTDSVSQDDYFYRLLTSKYCLCPEGNGLDSYRILECLYLGCLPIIVTNLENPRWARVYNVPVVRPNEIGACIASLMQTNTGCPELPESCYLDYWKEKMRNV